MQQVTRALKQRYDSGGFRAVNFFAKKSLGRPVYAGLALRRESKLAGRISAAARPSRRSVHVAVVSERIARILLVVV